MIINKYLFIFFYDNMSNRIKYIYEVWNTHYATGEHDRVKVYLENEKAEKEAIRLNKKNDYEGGSLYYYTKKTRINR